MANLTQAAGGNGVAGSCSATELLTQIDAVTGSVSGANLSSTETTAVRSSVAKSQKGYGSPVANSNVYSVTQSLRYAYSGVEADAARQAITRT
tara:strand:+ start:66 stop:344 length:279 start_codon:yes stop_codon:yes gene_type:complete